MLTRDDARAGGRCRSALARVARVARAGRAAAVVAVAATVGAVVTACAPAAPVGVDELAREMFDLSNAERVEAGLAPLEWSDCLADKALERAAPFADDRDLVHDTLIATCHEGAMAGENLSRSERAAAEVVELWMESPGHRANILRAEFVIAGIGCVEGPDGVRACAHLFEGAAD